MCLLQLLLNDFNLSKQMGKQFEPFSVKKKKISFFATINFILIYSRNKQVNVGFI